MDKQLKKEIIKLVKGECANYDRQFCNINHYCCGLDKTCLFFMEDESITRCGYLEKGVFSLDADLEREYHEYHSGNQEFTYLKNVKPKIRCRRCGDHIEANSNRQRYCEGCRKYNEKEKARLRKQKSRNIG